MEWKMNKKLLARVEALKDNLDNLRPLPKAALERLRKQIVVEWTFNSNAIEGNTLTLKETELILNEGITISGKPLREHFEAINHSKAILVLEDFVKKTHKLSEEIIKKLHGVILKNIDDEEAGSYRRQNVRILASHHLPPDYHKVPSLMEQAIAWYSENKRKMHLVELATAIHHKLVNIHPFIDGNGRCARLAMNLLLMQKGYPPVVILKTDRKKYYRLLGQADLGKTEEFADFILKGVERSLLIYLHAFQPTKNKSYEKQGYISLSEATKYCPYSQEYLSLIARRGKLNAVKFQRNWMTTRDAIKEYMNYNSSPHRGRRLG